MNYPLGAAITSFVGAGRLDRRVLDQHFTIAAAVRDEDGPTFAGRLQRALTVVRAGGHRGPAQPARQPRHAALPVDGRRRRDVAASWRPSSR